MELAISDEARAFVQARGGALYVRASSLRCCGGALVVLDASTSAPGDARGYVAYPAHGVELYYRGNPDRLPRELVVELKGRRRPRLAAYKDGCAFPG